MAASAMAMIQSGRPSSSTAPRRASAASESRWSGRPLALGDEAADLVEAAAAAPATARAPRSRRAAASHEARLGPAVLAHPVLDQRPRQGPHIDARVEHPADALGHHHGLLQQQQLRLRLHLELLGDLEQLRQQPAERDLVQRPAQDRLADGAARLGEPGARLVRRDIAGLEMHLGDAARSRRSGTPAACRRDRSASCGRAGP